MADYSIIGKRARVQLYDRLGRLVGAIEGRVADVSEKVPVGKDPNTGEEIRKDLVWVVDIQPLRDPEGNEVPYTNSAGAEGEGWFARQDVTVIDEELPLPPWTSAN
jgi:hypothetical protein